MNRLDKYKGIIPALYACYDDNGDISATRTKNLVEYLCNNNVKGLYVGGSSGECTYQTTEERMEVLENVMEVAKSRLTIIAHVGAPSTRDSIKLAKHAESLGVDAIASIPPIYFRLPEHSIEAYWRAIADSTNLDFFIYNIPQLTGYDLSTTLYSKLFNEHKTIGVKNSSMPVTDICKFKAIGGSDSIVFNGPDEQLVGGLASGADGGIGGTYGVAPWLYIKAIELVNNGKLAEAMELQRYLLDIIVGLCSCKGNMYSVIKYILRTRGIECGDVRQPLSPIIDSDIPNILNTSKLIDEVTKRFC